MNAASLFHDVLQTHECGIDAGMCACQSFTHVTGHEGFAETVEQIQAIALGVLEHSTPEDLQANSGHLITLVIALGYALGSNDAMSTLASLDALSVTVPDDLSSLDTLESPALGDRPDDN